MLFHLLHFSLWLYLVVAIEANLLGIINLYSWSTRLHLDPASAWQQYCEQAKDDDRFSGRRDLSLVARLATFTHCEIRIAAKISSQTQDLCQTLPPPKPLAPRYYHLLWHCRNTPLPAAGELSLRIYR